MKNYHLMIVLCVLLGCKPDPSKILPSINILQKDSLTIVNTYKIQGGNPMVLINFEADCKHCQDETDSLLKYINQFPRTRFCFLNMVSLQQCRAFSRHFKLANYSNIIIGQDTGKVFPKHIGSRSTPMSVVYDGRKKMVVKFIGEAKMADLVPILQDLNGK